MSAIKLIRKILKCILPYGVVRIVQKHSAKELIASTPQQSYYCKALSGLSGYNISINSDMTVSCNCGTHDKGVLGDLTKQSFKQIFYGQAAEKMRDELLCGRHPVDICYACCELVQAPYFVARFHRNNYHMPKLGIMVENCSACNYKCPGCIKDVLSGRFAKIMSTDNIEKIAKEVRDNNIQGIHLFKFGEPFMDNDIYNKVRTIREYNPKIHLHTSTNGMLINNESKINAALLFDHIEFSIDGTNTEIQNKYQKGADFDIVIENVKKIKAARGNAEKPILVWKYVVFSWNDSKECIEDVFNTAAGYGFDKIMFTVGYSEDSAAVTVRYFESSFIPCDKEKLFETYSAGWGMLFNLKA